MTKKAAGTLGKKAVEDAVPFIKKYAYPTLKKYAGPAASSALALAWKRLGWQYRAALAAGSVAVGTYRKIAGVRNSLKVGHLGRAN